MVPQERSVCQHRAQTVRRPATISGVSRPAGRRRAAFRGHVDMNILLFLAHPTPGSFNHAIAAECRAALLSMGHCVLYHDLYAERFDPILPGEEVPKTATLNSVVAQHCRELGEADGIVVVHPNWWGQPPAILKGWIDRVVRPGVAYRFNEGDSGEGVPVGLLRARTAVVFNTGNISLAREESVFGDPLDRPWRDCIFGLCGVTDVRRRLFGVVVTSAFDERAAWLTEAMRLVTAAFPANAQPRTDAITTQHTGVGT